MSQKLGSLLPYALEPLWIYHRRTVTFPAANHCHLPLSRYSFPVPLRVGDWVDRSDWVHTKMVYRRTVTRLTTNRARRTVEQLRWSDQRRYQLGQTAIRRCRPSSGGLLYLVEQEGTGWANSNRNSPPPHTHTPVPTCHFPGTTSRPHCIVLHCNWK